MIGNVISAAGRQLVARKSAGIRPVVCHWIGRSGRSARIDGRAATTTKAIVSMTRTGTPSSRNEAQKTAMTTA